jgi:predicted regulator of Ras-like GTPase activity (Roadblock/LC7/MglB family)
MATVIAETLRQVVEQVEGAQAAILVDEDGLTVDSVCHPEAEVDPESLSAECNTVVARARDAVERLEFGAVGELIMSTEQLHLLCCFVRGGYYLILVLSRSALLGKGRFYLQRVAFLLRSEL